MENNNLISHEIDIDHIRYKQSIAQEKQNIKKLQFKNKVKEQTYRHIMKQVRNKNKLNKDLATQAQKSKNYLKLTKYVNPLSNPLIFSDRKFQWEVLDEVANEIEKVVQDILGIEFEIDLFEAKLTFLNISLGIEYNLYLLYTIVEHLN